ncbi:hypothetical protein L211DRAFT_844579 [Terfezia boudieri ATCC MYA-4762]|uniref:Transcription factor TFIIIC triple barrel domain-containing protein n=1 Tax=Terfezia boudieri ATCC MYA-4762 TaxID=1051890 RepID=A0A3N4MC77_9PEZI|nr:hypothetical protein L211DRAFT_844579 [Terfezia boudieri ATCC MYA-4762]
MYKQSRGDTYLSARYLISQFKLPTYRNNNPKKIKIRGIIIHLGLQQQQQQQQQHMPTSRRGAGAGRRRRERSGSHAVLAPESMTAAATTTTTTTTTHAPPPDVPIAPELLMQDAEASAAAGGVQAVEEGESEWEYDWDDSPTTVLPSAASTASRGKKAANKSSAAAATVDGDDDDDDNDDADDDDDYNNTSTNKNNKTTKSNPSNTAQYPTRFQLQALPSLTPLVSYHNRIFSCEWTVPLGSEIFITSKNKSGCVQREAEVVGVGQIRLHGHPAIVTARSRTEDHRTTRTGTPGKGEGQLAAGKDGMGGRTAFWKRLEEVKRRKRETEGVDPAERDRRENGEENREGEGEGDVDMEGAETGCGKEGISSSSSRSSHGGNRGKVKGVGRGIGRRKEVIGHEQEIRQLEEMERDLDLEEINLDVDADEADEADRRRRRRRG